ncbi:PD-(D/E)XK nuclease family protein [Patescibacteria group bacterium]|nr:PD-(D/E)XK nuclease family protein [Patescibacteria group bacterium]MBU4481260.1 PD-(D/E)XK nuclease family protein [Patescibacteria group bacterium]
MKNNKPIKLSPNSLNLYYECQLCFWLDKRQGIRRPQPYPYALNIAVDLLLKEEFDKYRKKRDFHPLLVAYNIPAKLFPNQKLIDEWRNNFKGIRYYDPILDATLFGAVDDILEFTDGKLAPLDYKSTGSTVPKVYDRFQLQMDIYTYLLEKNGYKTVRKGCLAFYIVDKKNGFKDRLPFKKEIHIIDTDPSYVPGVFKEAVALLKRETPPFHSPDCQYGHWLKSVSKIGFNPGGLTL